MHVYVHIHIELHIQYACVCIIMCIIPVVLSLLRLDHLKILSLSRGPPLKIVPWKIAKIGLFVCLYSYKIKKVAFPRGPPVYCKIVSSLTDFDRSQ